MRKSLLYTKELVKQSFVDPHRLIRRFVDDVMEDITDEQLDLIAESMSKDEILRITVSFDIQEKF